MFKNKKKGKVEENAVVSKVDKDLIVHNMPKGGSVNSLATNNNSGQSLGDGNDKFNNFKIVGALIIGLGIILVGVLIYLSYVFIIKPQSKSNVLIEEQIDEENKVEEIKNGEIKEEDILATSTSSEAKSPDKIDIEDDNKSNIATSSDEFIEDSDDQNQNNEEIIDFLPVLDSDDDGLSDDEEEALGTNPNKADSDDDGYSDLAEIQNAYDPTGSGRLDESSFLIRYNSPVADYSFLYPSSWSLDTSNNDYTVLISAPDNSFIQVSVQPNIKMQNISAWYEDTVSKETLTYEQIEKGTGWEGVLGEDDFYFYLTDEKRTYIYVISYIPVISKRLAYSNIFQLAIDSFEIE
jgi:hypothetical protein